MKMFDIKRFEAKSLMHEEKVRSEKKAAKRDQRFTVLYLRQAATACEATRTQQAFIWIWLQYLAWEAGYKPFPVTNERLKVYGISRFTKKRALAAYEKAGLISVVRYKINTPVVTILVPVKRFT